ncbi:MAG: (2Fe-2S)-binding protein [Pseudoxanthomonas suwonensis]|nr:(2Fe-2S)-binding protein [Pseudoxanthomonas suwonensis]
MYVCVCNGVTDREIRDVAEAGCGSVAELTMRTGAGAGCGSCLDMAEALMQQVGASHSALPVLEVPLAKVA